MRQVDQVRLGDGLLESQTFVDRARLDGPRQSPGGADAENPPAESPFSQPQSKRPADQSDADDGDGVQRRGVRGAQMLLPTAGAIMRN